MSYFAEIPWVKRFVVAGAQKLLNYKRLVREYPLGSPKLTRAPVFCLQVWLAGTTVLIPEGPT